MRLFDSIVVLVVVVQLTLLGSIQTLGAVLCIEADGRAEVEELGCNWALSHDEGQEVDGPLATEELNQDHCQSCVDIPSGIGINRVAVRVLSKEQTEPNTLPAAEIVRSIPEPVNHLRILVLNTSHIRVNSTATILAPLRI